ncbi:MAG: helix-turn-helix transcriptional regulator [Rikenellaceae bacterium]
MKEKITYLMKSEGLTTTRFAEILGIQPSTVSHLVSGRNKPGYDLLQKILRRFPRINPDWLLLDLGEPLRPDQDEDDPSPLCSGVESENSQDFAASSLFGLHNGQNSPIGGVGSEKKPQNNPLSQFNGGNNGLKSPIFVVVFYDDGSCEKFSMPR